MATNKVTRLFTTRLKSALFKMPNRVKITGRTSTITNSFVNSIIPVITPSQDQVLEALSLLEMTEETYQCAYCGDKVSEWDHLRPLVLQKRATGYISEIHNLVPACGKCNQSKGSRYWKDWILSDAPNSPKARQIADLQDRIRKLEAYEAWKPPTKLDFESIVGSETWKQHWDNCERLHALMKESQVLAETINRLIDTAHKKMLDGTS